MPAAVVAALVAARLTSAPPVNVSGQPFSILGQQVCPRLVRALPDRLGTLDGRRVAGAPATAAAWGDPPVVLRCGVPPRISPASQIVVLDGIDWTTDVDSAGVTWTTVGRQVNVEVRVPGRYDSQGPLLAMLSPVLQQIIPKA